MTEKEILLIFVFALALFVAFLIYYLAYHFGRMIGYRAGQRYAKTIYDPLLQELKNKNQKLEEQNNDLRKEKTL